MPTSIRARTPPGKPECRDRAEIDSARADDVLGPDALRLADERAEAADAVAADVHQRSASELGAHARVLRIIEVEAERRSQASELADCATLDELCEPICLRMVAGREALRQPPTGPLCRVERALHFVRVPAEGLLAEDVLARLERSLRPFGVQSVRQGDVDGVDVGVLEQRPVVAVRARDAVLARVRVGAGCVAARNRDHVRELRFSCGGKDLGVDGRGREQPEPNRDYVHDIQTAGGGTVVTCREAGPAGRSRASRGPSRT
jgi:hypothetical protein